MIVYNYIG